MNKQIRIPIKKRNTFIAFAIFLIALYYGQSYFRMYFDKIIAQNSLRLLLEILTISFLILSVFIFLVYRLIKPKMSLIIDGKGITDKSSFLYSESIRWQHIEKIIWKEKYKENLLLLFLNDPIPYISEVKGVIKLKLLRKNQTFYGTCFVINLTNFDYDSRQLAKLIQKEFSKYKMS